MRELRDKVAAITGAGSGIGRALALALAQSGCRLALSDINEQGLAETATLLRERGAEAHTSTLDVAEREAVFAWAESVARHHGCVNLLFNNAGVSLTAAVSEMPIADFEWLMNINFWGAVHGTQAFLPHLAASGDGHVVNISSIFGIMAVPTQAAYNASKFAIKGFTEALRMEMQLEGYPVGVTCVHPGGIQTNIARSGRYAGKGRLHRAPARAIAEFEDQLARNSADYCARKIIDGVQRNSARVVVGGDAKLLALLVRWLPTAYLSLLVRQRKRSLSKSNAVVNDN